MEATKKITRGNDFRLRIPLRRVKNGTREPFPLSSSKGIAVSLVNQFRRYLLDREVDTTDDSVIIARVEGDKIPCGTYAVEVKGRQLGDDWRTAECGQIQIVEWSSQADSDLGDLVDGEVIEISALTVGVAETQLNPRGEWTEGTTYHKGDTVSHSLRCWYAKAATTTEPTEDTSDWVILLEAVSIEEELSSSAEAALKAAEEATATAKTISENEVLREAAELTRKTNEATRATAEEARESAETARATAETTREADTAAAISKAEEAISAAEKVNAELSGSTLTITNHKGESKSTEVSGGGIAPFYSIVSDETEYNDETTLASDGVQAVVFYEPDGVFLALGTDNAYYLHWDGEADYNDSDMGNARNDKLYSLYANIPLPDTDAEEASEPTESVLYFLDATEYKLKKVNSGAESFDLLEAGEGKDSIQAKGCYALGERSWAVGMTSSSDLGKVEEGLAFPIVESSIASYSLGSSNYASEDDPDGWNAAFEYADFANQPFNIVKNGEDEVFCKNIRRGAIVKFSNVSTSGYKQSSGWSFGYELDAANGPNNSNFKSTGCDTIIVNVGAYGAVETYVFVFGDFELPEGAAFCFFWFGASPQHKLADSHTGNMEAVILATNGELTKTSDSKNLEFPIYLGMGTTASGMDSHAEGYGTTASGMDSHAEGYGTTASGMGSHAEGIYNKSNKFAIHSVGIATAEQDSSGNFSIKEKNAEEILYVSDKTGNGDEKNGYKYLVGLGDYDGTNLVNSDGSLNTSIKSVQEVITDLINRTVVLEEAAGIESVASLALEDEEPIYPKRDLLKAMIEEAHKKRAKGNQTEATETSDGKTAARGEG